MILMKNLKSADLVTFTEEILNGKLHFLCSVHKALAAHGWNSVQVNTTFISPKSDSNTGSTYDRYLNKILKI